MKSSLKLYLIVFCSVSCYLLLMIAAVSHKHSRYRKLTPLESNVAQVRLGITESEVDTLMGSAPDTISQTTGVVSNSVTMLHATNEKASKYGTPQEVSLRSWNRDGVIATVAFDQEGKVVCRWAGAYAEKRRSYNPYSPYQVFKRLGIF